MSDESSSSESDEEFLEHCLSKLKPYDFEPLASSSNDECEDDESKEDLRKGKSDWCQCGYCLAMENEKECWCCSEANEISDELFEGTLVCIVINDSASWLYMTKFVFLPYFLLIILQEKHASQKLLSSKWFAWKSLF